MLDSIINIVDYVVSIDSNVLKVFLLSMIPVTECRLSIPYFIFKDYNVFMIYIFGTYILRVFIDMIDTPFMFLSKIFIPKQ